MRSAERGAQRAADAGDHWRWWGRRETMELTWYRSRGGALNLASWGERKGAAAEVRRIGSAGVKGGVERDRGGERGPTGLFRDEESY